MAAAASAAESRKGIDAAARADSAAGPPPPPEEAKPPGAAAPAAATSTGAAVVAEPSAMPQLLQQPSTGVGTSARATASAASAPAASSATMPPVAASAAQLRGGVFSDEQWEESAKLFKDALERARKYEAACEAADRRKEGEEAARPRMEDAQAECSDEDMESASGSGSCSESIVGSSWVSSERSTARTNAPSNTLTNARSSAGASARWSLGSSQGEVEEANSNSDDEVRQRRSGPEPENEKRPRRPALAGTWFVERSADVWSLATTEERIAQLARLAVIRKEHAHGADVLLPVQVQACFKDLKVEFEEERASIEHRARDKDRNLTQGRANAKARSRFTAWLDRRYGGALWVQLAFALGTINDTIAGFLAHVVFLACCVRGIGGGSSLVGRGSACCGQPRCGWSTRTWHA